MLIIKIIIIISKYVYIIMLNNKEDYVLFFLIIRKLGHKREPADRLLLQEGGASLTHFTKRQIFHFVFFSC